MAQPIKRVVIGTRGSALARWQTDHVADLLRAAWPGLDVAVRVISTQGDRVLDTPLPLMGGKGVFTAELESALHSGDIDLAVHSLKDLPTDDPAGLTVGAIPLRAEVADALVSRAGTPFAALPHGATIGTSSRRRAAQLLHARPDLHITDIRGNVDTRLRKAHDPNGPYDAILLAAAGLTRLGLHTAITQQLPLEVMLPAPGQGALAVQCREDTALHDLLQPLDHAPTRLAVTAERAFLAALGGGCSLPIAAHATVSEGTIHLRGRVSAPDGGEQMDFAASAPATHVDATALGAQIAADALRQGVGRLLSPSHEQSAWALRRQYPRGASGKDAGRPAARARRNPIAYPCIALEPLEDTATLDDALRDLTHGRYDWLVLTSTNTVQVLAQRLTGLELGVSTYSVRVAAVGPATAHAAEQLLDVPVEVIADEHIAEALAKAIQPVAGQRVLLPQSALADDILPQTLADAGAQVDAINAYTMAASTGGVPLLPLLQTGGVDAVTLTSSSTARFLVERLVNEGGSVDALNDVCVACIGPKTMKAARTVGLHVAVVADTYTLDGLVDALDAHFGQQAMPFRATGD